jgi:polyhydroxybutyrate depolymerase
MSKNDPLMPFDGGTIKSSATRGVGGTVLSAQATVNMWATFHHCTSSPTLTQLPVTFDDGTSAVLQDYGSCGVQWYVETGAGHTWPGGDPAFTDPAAQGTTSLNLIATQVMIDFFGL